MTIAVPVNVFAIYILEDQVGLPVGEDPRVEELRDIRMSQTAKNAAFTFESVLAGSAGQRKAQKLDRGAAFEPPIDTFGKPDTPHSTLADPRDQPVCANRLTRKCRTPRRQIRILFQKAFLCGHPVLIEQCFQEDCKLRIALVQRSNENGAFA